MKKPFLYAPADPAKRRKPKPGHPWTKFMPGWLKKRDETLPHWRDNK